jgi:hypothetical protein
MVLVGVFFFITVVKLGIPVVLDFAVAPPEGWQDAILGVNNYSWPVKWGYLLMIPVLLSGLFAIRWKPFPGKCRWLLFLPALWLGWECVDRSGAGSFFGLRGLLLFGLVCPPRYAESLAGMGRTGTGALLDSALRHGAAFRRFGGDPEGGS